MSIEIPEEISYNIAKYITEKINYCIEMRTYSKNELVTKSPRLCIYVEQSSGVVKYRYIVLCVFLGGLRITKKIELEHMINSINNPEVIGFKRHPSSKETEVSRVYIGKVYKKNKIIDDVNVYYYMRLYDLDSKIILESINGDPLEEYPINKNTLVNMLHSCLEELL